MYYIDGMEIVSMGDIAKRLNVKPGTVRQWRWRELLPEPDYHLANGPAWKWATIEQWASDTNRMPTDQEGEDNEDN